MNFVGIENVGEFYSPHYFRSLVTDDIKGLVDDWKTDHERKGRRLPWEALEGVASQWSDAYAKAAETDDAVERWEMTREIHVELLDALGYEYDPQAVSIGDPGSGRVIPTICTETRDGQPWLWAVEAPLPKGEDAGTFDQPVLPDQLAAMPEFRNLGKGPNAPSAEELLPWNDELDEPASWQTIFDDRILAMETPPRWILFFSGRAVALIDRQKWGRGEYLNFDLQKLFDNRETKTLRATCALLHRDAINPDEDVPLLEELETESHKHAHSVSTELKHSARKAIELLANEVVWYRRNVGNLAVFSWEGNGGGPGALADALTDDCLTFLYRLLFLLYAEARGGELGIVPTDSRAYRQGYSIESLRDLELKRLETDRARNGYYMHESLRRLFEIVNEGFNDRGSQSLPFRGPPIGATASSPSNGTAASPPSSGSVSSGSRDLSETFAVDGLQSRLFDDERLNLLDEVKLRNTVLQKVIRLLSLSDADSGERDRISYSELGINQLGAVYEGLLSYEGFFAREKTYEVRDPDDMNEEDPRAWFVPASEIDKYRDEEIVTTDADGFGPDSTVARASLPSHDGEHPPVVYERGTFLFRRAGRAREQSASYYTPQELTECLTKYTLKERIGEPPAPGWEDEWDPEGEREELTADEILDLTICEPAMGSGAFINEAVEQLADHYLERKQTELGESLSPEDYRRKKRRVMYYLATRNCYGVDLNPMAAELGKISMWLNVLHRGAKAPWFDARISVGNSIVGARRAVYRPDALRLQGDADWRTDPPELVRDIVGRASPPSRSDDADTSVGRASLPSDGTRASLPSREQTALPSRPDGTVYHFLLPARGMCPFDDVDEFEELAGDHQDRISAWRKRFTQPLEDDEIERLQALSDRIDAIWRQHLRDRRDVLDETAPPVDVYGQPSPDRDRWPTVGDCEDAAARLRVPDAAGPRLKRAMDDWCALWFWPTRESESLPERQTFWDGIEARLEPGHSADLDHLPVARDVADRYTFQHWETEFPEIFADDGGFDVVIGNPPWVDVSWSERGILSEMEPKVGLRTFSSAEAKNARNSIIQKSTKGEARYLASAEHDIGAASFLASRTLYDLLKSHKPNTYKNFLSSSWQLQKPRGVTALVHPNGVYNYPRGQKLRTKLLRTVRYRFHFRNELRLFGEIDNQIKFSLNVYGRSKNEIGFFQIADLFYPITIDRSFQHDGLGPVPGMKDSDGNWQLRGHQNRIVFMNLEKLASAESALGDGDQSVETAEVPLVFARELLATLERVKNLSSFAQHPVEWFAPRTWREGERKDDGTIIRHTHWPRQPSELIYSGPSIFVGNPLYKTPDANCASNRDYSVVDLVEAEYDYLPRSTYQIGCTVEEYQDRSHKWKGDVFWNYYRHGHREYVPSDGERTLAGAILPPGTAHVHGIVSFAFETRDSLLTFNALACSIPYDFLPRVSAHEHLNVDFVSSLPFEPPEKICQVLRARAARLNCLTVYYRELWEECFEDAWREDGFTVDTDDYPQLTPWSEEVESEWTMDSALRNRFERRQALLELDALGALALDLTADQLCTIYRIQFPVLREYEQKTFYDQRGKVVYSRKANFGVVGINEFRKFRDAETKDEMLEAAREKYFDVLQDFEPPFVRCDREEDMRHAYQVFEERLDYEVDVSAKKIVSRDATDSSDTPANVFALIAEELGINKTSDLPKIQPFVPRRLAPFPSKENTTSEMAPMHIAVPYAHDLERLNSILWDVARGLSVEEIAESQEIGGRAVHRYLHLANILGLIAREQDEKRLTTLGGAFMTSSDVVSVIKPAVSDLKVVSLARQLRRSDKPFPAAVEEAIRRHSNLSGESVLRRARCVVKLARQCGLADQTSFKFDYTSELEETGEAARRPSAEGREDADNQPRPSVFETRDDVPDEENSARMLFETSPANAGTFGVFSENKYTAWVRVANVAERGNRFVARVDGDSMAPEFEDGDFLLFRRAGIREDAPEVGDICLVEGFDSHNKKASSYLLKELAEKSSDKLRLRPRNEKYKEIVLSRDQRARVIGVYEKTLKLENRGDVLVPLDEDGRNDRGNEPTADSGDLELQRPPVVESETPNWAANKRTSEGSDAAEDEIEKVRPETGPLPRVPQANSLETLRDVLDQLAAGRRREAAVAERLELSERTVRYYFDLAGWLGLVETEGPRAETASSAPSIRGPARLTELGRRFTGASAAARSIARRRLESTPLVRAVRNEAAWPDRPQQAVLSIIERRTRLEQSTAKRRAHGVTSLLARVGLPEESAGEETFEIVSARRLPVGVLDPPGLVGSTLEELEVETLGDLLELEAEGLEELSGIGPKKADGLRDLRERARRAAGLGESDDPQPTGPDPLASGVADALLEAGYASRDPWNEIPLEIPTRIESALEEAGIHLLGEVVGVLAHLDLEQLPGVGESTATEWRRRLERLATQGWDAYRFGPGGRPNTVSELVELLMRDTTPRQRRVLRRRVLEDVTLQEIADPLGLSRQRVRQIFTSTIDEFADKFAGVAADLTAPLRRVLEGDGVGLVHRHRARRTVGTDDLFHLVLALRIAGVADAVIWEDHFIRTTTKSDIQQAVTDLEGHFRDTNKLFLRVDEVLRFADAVGFDLSADGLEELLHVGSDAAPDRRGRFRNPRATKGDRVAEALREARRPLDLDELGERFTQTYADEDEPSDRDTAQRYAKSHPHIYTVEFGLYVHRESLPVDEDAIAEVRERCIEYLREKRHAISTVWMLDELLQTDLASGGRLDDLTPILLRDILIRHENVGTSVSSYNVTWEPTYAYENVTLPDRIERILRAADSPVTAADIERGFPDDFYVNPSSIEQILDEADWAIAVGDHQYSHVHSVGLTDDERQAALDAAVDALPTPESADADKYSVTSATRLWDEIADDPALATIRERADEDDRQPEKLLFGLLRGDDRVATSNGELLTRRDTLEANDLGLPDSASLFDHAIMETVHATYPSYPREVTGSLRERFGGDQKKRTIRQHLHKLHEDGHLGHLTTGLYFPADLPDDELFDRFAEVDRDLVKLTDRSDFEDLPDDELWLLARYFEDAGRLTDAKKVLDVLVERQHVEEVWEELYEEVRRELEKLI